MTLLARPPRPPTSPHDDPVGAPQPAFRTQRLAKAWLMIHGFKRALDVKPKTYRARQVDPARFARGSFRTIHLTAGVEAVIGHLRTL